MKDRSFGIVNIDWVDADPRAEARRLEQELAAREAQETAHRIRAQVRAATPRTTPWYVPAIGFVGAAAAAVFAACYVINVIMGHAR